MKAARYVLLLTVLFAIPERVYSQDYTILKLPTLGGAATRAFAINAKGQVAGVSDTTTMPHAILWSMSGGLQDLQTLAAVQSTGYAINNNGVVVGSVDLCDCGLDPFVWAATSGMKIVSRTKAIAYGINSHREIVGINSGNPSSAGFLWTPSGGMQDLSQLGCAYCSPSGVNDNGQIVGSITQPDGTSHAFVWSQTLGVSDLGTLGGANSSGHAINNQGQVVGVSDTASGVRHAFFWSLSTGMQDLGTLPGESNSWASAINARGQVVGFSWNPGKVHGLPFIWTEENGMKELGPFSPPISSADGINKAGQILLSTFGAHGYSSYLITPVMHTTLTSTPNPSHIGEAVTFTATVNSAVQGPPPDGELVTFVSGTVTLGSAPLKHGVATLTLTFKASRTLRAIYAGDVNYASSKSAQLSQVVE
jgi:probable HAF family extracellular repeat protein